MRESRSAAVARQSRAAAAPPRPLALLLIVVAVFGVCWAMLVPPFQSPDVFTHLSYAESLATHFDLPGRAGRPESSSSVQAADLAAGGHRVQWSAPEAKPSWDPAVARAYRAAAARLSRSDGGGPGPSQANPPLYYAYAAVAYTAAIGGDAFDRLNAIQLAGVLLLLAAVVGGWLLAGEVFGPRRLLQLACAAVVGLVPMETFMSTSVNPDALLVPIWTFWLWAGARVIRHGAARRDVIALCALTAAGILAKETSYALLPALALALVFGWRGRPAADRSRDDAVRTFGPAILTLWIPVQAWILVLGSAGRPSLAIGAPTLAGTGTHGASYLTGALDYLWQFYLPRLPGQATFHVPTLASLPLPRLLPGLPVWNVWIREGWGVFGWLDVYMPTWVYAVLAAATAAVALPGTLILTGMRDRLRRSLVAYFALTLLALLAVAHEIEYQSLRTGDGPFIQGRYALPLIALFGLGTALLLSRLPARLRGPACALLLVGLLALQVIGLASVAKAFYT